MTHPGLSADGEIITLHRLHKFSPLLSRTAMEQVRMAIGERGPWQPVNVLVVDTETTGLDAAKDRIVELAMMRLQVDAVSGLVYWWSDAYDSLEEPGIPIPQHVTEIHGITDSDVVGQRIDDGAVIDAVEWADLIVAHNAAFDRGFLTKRIPASAGKIWACSVNQIDWTGHRHRHLVDLCFDHGLFYDAHRAVNDVIALAQLLNVGDRFGELVKNARQDSVRYRISGRTFDHNARIKALGYRWNGDEKVWWKQVTDGYNASEELAYGKVECVVIPALHNFDAAFRPQGWVVVR